MFALTPGHNENGSLSVNTGTHEADDDNHIEIAALPGDTVHTYLEFASPLAYKFKRSTVRIRANVVRATHGETRREVLGSGDAAKALQTFTLKQAPLTYVSASTVSGRRLQSDGARERHRMARGRYAGSRPGAAGPQVHHPHQ
ncbi:hypothetical protein LP419_31085 [Massilia sp. H-1]|nr:hypothetical protein LP419_31085 [Massilia sp. H-1]